MLPESSANRCVVNLEFFNYTLQLHPNIDEVNYILQGLKYGFDIGFSGPSTNTLPKNCRSASVLSTQLGEAVKKEVERNHTAGPFRTPPFPITHCSPIGAVEKDDGSARIVMDLSRPQGNSINEWISKDEFSVLYSKFDDAVKMVVDMGPGCFMSKLDVKHAFRLIPVHSSQWHLLCYQFQGFYYVDLVLPFGLRSSPAIFCRFADLVKWVIINYYGIPMVINYSDDFFKVSCQDYDIAKDELRRICQAFKELGIPLALEKIFGPLHRIIYLGIIIDSIAMTMEVTEERYLAIMASFPKWLKRNKCTKTKLESLIGLLSFVAKVVIPGRLFLRRLIDVSKTVKKGHHHISLNSEAKADIAWWYEFLPDWSKKSVIPQSNEILASDLKLFTDASDLGFGAIYGSAWIHGSWPPGYKDLKSINFRELFAIVAAAETWGNSWSGKRIVFITDNEPITDIWGSGSSKCPEIMRLIRHLFLIAVRGGVSVSFKHTPGVDNPVADALSRFQMEKYQLLFRHLVPQADPQATQVPPPVFSLL